jgi:formamidopyrimidine-DNA glycosylase
MLELPEAVNMANQLNATIQGKRIASVTAGHTPHKLAWYYGDRAEYAGLLTGRTTGKAGPVGGLVEIEVGDARILLGEGTNIRFQAAGEARPAKHQLLIEFEDGSSLSCSVQMYGGMGSFKAGTLDNPYYKAAKEKTSPYSAAFNEGYFNGLISFAEAQKLSLKALLATEQRIPGLGNGVLQDILFKAGMHPKKKAQPLSGEEKKLLFQAVKDTLSRMAEQGGRDTELDLFGRPGGYRTILSKNTVSKPCAVCGTLIKKEAYMGGTVYYCEKCQKI